jgi:glucosylceramidase
VLTDKKLQTIEGFGACFSEMGWASLNLLSDEDKATVFSELYEPGVGANFTICRMPVAANDFALDWYSYNETEGDFAMDNFSIANDLKSLVPFIKTAQEYNPRIKIWASPWSPPSWMKYNKHYASKSSVAFGQMFERMRAERESEGGDAELPSFARNLGNPAYQNDLPPEREGFEGTDMFVQEDKYLEAYALYFSKFIEAYRNEGIDIFAVMPQNEFNSAQVFPSCCWTAKGLASFIGSYLGPAMEEMGVEVLFGTMERANEALVDTVLLDEKSGQYIKGVGFQWAGKDALPGINKRYPDLIMYQTEQECGDGKNDWKGVLHSWELMKHYLRNGVSVYEYWNTSLPEGGISRWGWAQNSLVVVNGENNSYRYSNEYYLLKHLTHFVLPGANMLETSGEFDNLLAFENTDSSLVIMALNDSDDARDLKVEIGGKILNAKLPANSINTFKFSD